MAGLIVRARQGDRRPTSPDKVTGTRTTSTRPISCDRPSVLQARPLSCSSSYLAATPRLSARRQRDDGRIPREHHHATAAASVILPGGALPSTVAFRSRGPAPDLLRPSPPPWTSQLAWRRTGSPPHSRQGPGRLLVRAAIRPSASAITHHVPDGDRPSRSIGEACSAGPRDHRQSPSSSAIPPNTPAPRRPQRIGRGAIKRAELTKCLAVGHRRPLASTGWPLGEVAPNSSACASASRAGGRRRWRSCPPCSPRCRDVAVGRPDAPAQSASSGRRRATSCPARAPSWCGRRWPSGVVAPGASAVCASLTSPSPSRRWTRGYTSSEDGFVLPRHVLLFRNRPNSIASCT